MAYMGYSDLTEDDVNGQLRIYSKKAEETLKDKRKIEVLLEKIKKWLSKHKDNVIFGSTISSIIDMVDLLTDYTRGRYTAIPTRALISLVAAVIYIVSPIDLIPDWLIAVGWLDDVAVVMAVLKLGLDGELRKYRKWKNDVENSLETENMITRIQDYLNSVFSNISENEVLGALFLTDDGELELIITQKENRLLPLPVRIVLDDVPIKTTTIDETISLFRTALNGMSVEWSAAGCIDFMLERDFTRFDDSFEIIGG